MPAIDPVSLILTNGLTSFALTAVLLVSRVGMGAEGRGIRTWVLGDIAMAAARIVAAATVAALPFARDLDFPVVPGSLAVAGLWAHAQALRSVAGQQARPLLIALQALGLAMLFYLLGSQMASLTHRMRLFDGMILCGSVVTLWLLPPLIRFWGARLIAAMMALAIVFQSLRFGALLVGIDVELPPEAAQDLRGSIGSGALVIDLVISLFITSGFVLLQQERLRERIERLVVTDPLTGSLNRRGMMPLLDSAWAQAQRYGRPMSVVMIDLDHFKRVNDQHGHPTGDEVLAGLAARVGAQLRTSDALGRWGGEEFLVLLNDTDLAAAHRVAERLRQTIEAQPMASVGLHITVSAGVSCFEEAANRADPDATRGLLQLLDAADRRLYLAKRQRNCVVSTESRPQADPAETAAR